MDDRVKELLRQGDHLFSKKLPLLTLWQEEADHFYPERADFTVMRSLGDNFADNLTTSYPILCRRELGNIFSSMLRPAATPWFFMRPEDEERENNEARRFLEWSAGVQRRAMYDKDSMFVRATKETDHDFATFGNGVISTELDRKTMTMLYRCWHLRDVAWCEGYNGQIDVINRKWRPTALEQTGTFREKVHQNVKDQMDKDPYAESECRHIVMKASDYYGSDKVKMPWVKIYVDVQNNHLIEETLSWDKMYTIPRWQTVSGSQYAHSPAVVSALPDARLIQAMSLVLLEAGEKAVSPPLIAVQNAIRSDISVFPSAITWVSEEYDERLGEVLRPMTQDFSGISLGIDLRADVKQAISDCFFLNKINLPPIDAQKMTAYEVSQRMTEWVRNALPIFEPAESEYNGQICEITFDIMMRNGGFGPVDNIPDSLKGANVQFRFESPLQQSEEKQKGSYFMQAKAMLAEAAALDQGALNMLDIRAALRDTLKGIGVPTKWVRSEDDMTKMDEETAQKQQMQEMMGALQQGGQAAEPLANAAKTFSEIQT